MVFEVIPEIRELIGDISSIAWHFLKSGIRSRELKQVAERKNFKLLPLPKSFDVRSTECIHDLLNSILTSWRAYVTYFSQSQDEEAKGFYKILTDKDALELLTFSADILEVFSEFQIALQRNDITIIEMVSQYESGWQ